MASKKCVSELDTMVKRFNLKRDETYHFVTQGIADGRLSAAGMGAARIMPAQRRFGRAITTPVPRDEVVAQRSEEHTSELQSRGHLVCRLLLEKKKSRSG